MELSDQVISTILKHDSKQTSYKIALLRAVNDVALAYPDLRHQPRDIAVPLRVLAEFWLAYYWPFVDPRQPIGQGARAVRGGERRNDLAFRPELTRLRGAWEEIHGGASAADGFLLVHDLRLPRKRTGYPQALLDAHQAALAKITTSLRQPIQYAGPGQWQVFPRPQPLHRLGADVAALPGSMRQDTCLLVPAALWRAFQKVSLWVEALCLHEWSLFTERVTRGMGEPIDRGRVYTLLTERPDNRRPLTWERNQIDLLLLEGHAFACPWTQRSLRPGGYDLDHLLPVSLYPINELWNLVPADPRFNAHVKRARLPSAERLARALPHLSATYATYQRSELLRRALWEDAGLRFGTLAAPASPQSLGEAVADYIGLIGEARNIATF